MARKMTPLPFQSYLLRCWQVQDEADPPVWHFALRDVSAEPSQHSFSTLEQLLAYIAADLHSSTSTE
jgi:hypothetical protein